MGYTSEEAQENIHVQLVENIIVLLVLTISYLFIQPVIQYY